MGLLVLMRQRMCWVMVCDECVCVEWEGEVCNMFVQRCNHGVGVVWVLLRQRIFSWSVGAHGTFIVVQPRLRPRNHSMELAAACWVKSRARFKREESVVARTEETFGLDKSCRLFELSLKRNL